MNDINRQFTAELDVYEMDAFGCLEKTGTKIVGPPERPVLNKWVKSPRATIDAPSLSSACEVANNRKAKGKLSEDALGFLESNANDVQHAAQGTILLSAASSGAQGWSITPDNFRKSMAIFAVRKVVKKTWLNNQDQFTIPAEEPLDEFYNDCLVYALFHGKNQTSSLKDVDYKGTRYQVRNQFHPYAPQQFADLVTGDVGMFNQLERGKPTFVYQQLQQLVLSAEARQLLDAGLSIYQEFYRQLPRLNRTKYRIDYWDVGWYQVRNALAEAGLCTEEFQAVKERHRRLADKLLPQVYSLGFLRR